MTAPQTWIPYCGAAPLPDALWSRWNFDPVLIGALALATILYFRASRTFPERRAWFAGAMGVALLLFISPVCALSSALFSARVTHHVLLSALLAPLLVLAFPPRFAGRQNNLALWTGVQAIVFWLWHAPPVYAFALSSDFAYWLMQASLLAACWGFWNAILQSPAPAAVIGLLATMIQMGLLGALITFSPKALYAPHFLTTQPWGFAPLEDQQLAGIMMWAPGSLFYLGAALLVLGRWLGSEDRQVRTS